MAFGGWPDRRLEERDRERERREREASDYKRRYRIPSGEYRRPHSPPYRKDSEGSVRQHPSNAPSGSYPRDRSPSTAHSRNGSAEHSHSFSEGSPSVAGSSGPPPPLNRQFSGNRSNSPETPSSRHYSASSTSPRHQSHDEGPPRPLPDVAESAPDGRRRVSDDYRRTGPPPAQGQARRGPPSGPRYWGDRGRGYERERDWERRDWDRERDRDLRERDMRERELRERDGRDRDPRDRDIRERDMRERERGWEYRERDRERDRYWPDRRIPPKYGSTDAKFDRNGPPSRDGFYDRDRYNERGPEHRQDGYDRRKFSSSPQPHPYHRYHDSAEDPRNPQQGPRHSRTSQEFSTPTTDKSSSDRAYTPKFASPDKPDRSAVKIEPSVPQSLERQNEPVSSQQDEAVDQRIHRVEPESSEHAPEDPKEKPLEADSVTRRDEADMMPTNNDATPVEADHAVESQGRTVTTEAAEALRDPEPSLPVESVAVTSPEKEVVKREEPHQDKLSELTSPSLEDGASHDVPLSSETSTETMDVDEEANASNLDIRPKESVADTLTQLATIANGDLNPNDNTIAEPEPKEAPATAKSTEVSREENTREKNTREESTRISNVAKEEQSEARDMEREASLDASGALESSTEPEKNEKKKDDVDYEMEATIDLAKRSEDLKNRAEEKLVEISSIPAEVRQGKMKYLAKLEPIKHLVDYAFISEVASNFKVETRGLMIDTLAGYQKKLDADIAQSTKEYLDSRSSWLKFCDQTEEELKQLYLPVPESSGASKAPTVVNGTPRKESATAPPPATDVPSTTPNTGGKGRRGRAAFQGDSVRSEAEFLEILASLERENAKDPLVRARLTSAHVPDMIFDPVEREKFLFADFNNLIRDKSIPYSRLTTDAIDPFSEEEHESFCYFYSTYPKEFGKIARSMGGTRTFNECVLHYYRTKKKVDYKALVLGRKRNARRTRRKPKAAVTPTSGTTPSGFRTAAASETEEAATAEVLSEVPVAILPRGDITERDYMEDPDNTTSGAPGGELKKRARAATRASRTAGGRSVKSHRRKDEIDVTMMDADGMPIVTDTAHDMSHAHGVMPVGPEHHPQPLRTDEVPIITEVHRDKVSSYWSQPEIRMFEKLLEEVGTRWDEMAKHIRTKSVVMLKNYYHKFASERGYLHIARDADARIANGMPLPKREDEGMYPSQMPTRAGPQQFSSRRSVGSQAVATPMVQVQQGQGQASAGNAGPPMMQPNGQSGPSAGYFVPRAKPVLAQAPQVIQAPVTPATSQPQTPQASQLPSQQPVMVPSQQQHHPISMRPLLSASPPAVEINEHPLRPTQQPPSRPVLPPISNISSYQGYTGSQRPVLKPTRSSLTSILNDPLPDKGPSLPPLSSELYDRQPFPERGDAANSGRGAGSSYMQLPAPMSLSGYQQGGPGIPHSTLFPYQVTDQAQTKPPPGLTPGLLDARGIYGYPEPTSRESNERGRGGSPPNQGYYQGGR